MEHPNVAMAESDLAAPIQATFIEHAQSCREEAVVTFCLV